MVKFLGLNHQRRSNLTSEIQLLERKIYLEENRMDLISEKFFREGGVCCPGCGVPGFTRLKLAQDRRRAWLVALKAKYNRRMLG